MSIYLKYASISIRSQLQYKASFIMNLLSNFLVFFTYYFTIICLFDKFSNVKGFKMYEVLFIFSIVQFGFSFCETFFRGVDLFDDLIVSGNFDRLLLRPRGILLQIFCQEICLAKLGRLIHAIIIFVIAILNLDIIWSIENIITILFMVISSIVLYMAIFILTAAYCFFTVKALEIRNLILYGSRELAQYPIGIFKSKIVMFFTYIIPFGFVNYYPLLFVLGKTNNKLLIISPLLTVVYLLISIVIFYRGLKRYSSVGS